MRLLLVSDFFPPVLGGLESHVDDLAAELAGRGHAVHVATLVPDATPSDPRVTVHRVRTAASRLLRYERSDRPFHPPVPDPTARAELTGLVDRLRPDLVHAHSWLGVSLPRHGTPPVVFTAHDYALACQLHTLLRPDGARCTGPSVAACITCGAQQYGGARSAAMTLGTIAGRRLLRPAAVLTLSEHVRSVLAPHVRAPIEVVPGFVRARGSADLQSLPAAPYAMYAGDPGRHKGLDLLLEVWSGAAAPALPLLVA